jgi:hypothetical protein
MGIWAGVDFADTHADARRRLDLRQFGIDEDAGDDACVASRATTSRRRASCPATSSPPSVVIS